MMPRSPDVLVESQSVRERENRSVNLGSLDVLTAEALEVRQGQALGIVVKSHLPKVDFRWFEQSIVLHITNRTP